MNDMNLQFQMENRQNYKIVEAVLQAALAAADPRQAVRRSMVRKGNRLQVGQYSVDLTNFRHVNLVGFGKASQLMLQGAVEILPDQITEGVVIAKHIDRGIQMSIPDNIEILAGSHPVPDEKSIAATEKVMELLKKCGEDDLVICLISGGGSALLTNPVDGITLGNIQELTKQLLACGAEIQEINTIRKHLDQVKGGRLARLAYPAQMITLILSDVVGSPLDIIASGPTVADPSSFSDAMSILHKYQLEQTIPAEILRIIEGGCRHEIPETPKPGHRCFEKVINYLTASNYLAAVEALEAARNLSFHAEILTTYMQGEARQMGRLLAGILRQIDESDKPFPRPACLVIGGETTVVLKGNGLGGRNLELALGAVSELQNIRDVALVTLATDGEDGPTDAAGAVVTGESFQYAIEAGWHPQKFLEENDSYTFFQNTGGLVKTGPTGTNVNDLVFLFSF